MVRRASITVFMSLILALILSLITTSITAVKTAAARSELANAADQAMFSLFAHYDRTLMEKYDVFFVDGSFGGDGLHLESACAFLEDAMRRVTEPRWGALAGGRDLIPAEIHSSSVTGYALATDLNGYVFAAQAVESMKETAAFRGLDLIADAAGYPEAAGEGLGVERTLETESLEGIEARAEAERAASAAGGETGGEASGLPGVGAVGGESGGAGTGQETPGEAEVSPQTEAQAASARESLEAVKTLRATSILRLVHPSPDAVSTETCNPTSLIGSRQKLSGMGVIDGTDATLSVTDGLLLNEYILCHFGSAVDPDSGSGLKYPLEEILKGKHSDAANLESLAGELLLIREGINVIHIYRDPALKEQAQTLAAAVAAVILLPEAEPLIEVLLIAGWAFAESLLDVRTLFSGQKIPFVKNTSDWQVGLMQIPAMAADMDAFRKPASTGMGYVDYLRTRLVTVGQDTKVCRMCAMVEHKMRGFGRAGFRLDTCLASLTVEVDASAGIVPLKAEKSLSYKEL